MAPSNILIILFSLSEIGLLIFRRSKRGVSKTQKDRRSLISFWIVIPLSLTAGTFAGGYGIWTFGDRTVWITTGIIVFVIGFAIRWTAIIQLGKMFTVDVAIDKTHQLKNSGLYKVVRHPSYSGLLLIITGIAISMYSLASCLILIVPVFAALHYRIKVEEEALESEFKSQYTTYKRSTSRLIPGVY
jgi:protein-S-isoprenylcysteine O-methyltransferase Ste14